MCCTTEANAFPQISAEGVGALPWVGITTAKHRDVRAEASRVEVQAKNLYINSLGTTWCFQWCRDCAKWRYRTRLLPKGRVAYEGLLPISNPSMLISSHAATDRVEDGCALVQRSVFGKVTWRF